MKKVIFWLPRVLTIVFILFVSMFALDSFSADKSLSKQIADFAIHIIPSLFLLLVLIIAWKWEWVGTLVYILLALLYIYITWEKRQYSWMLMISGPLLIIAFLFLINWILKKKAQDPKQIL